MINILIAIILACTIFLMIRLIYYITGNLASKLLKVEKLESEKVYISISIAVYFMYLLSLLCGIGQKHNH